jgi:aminoglycoside phosphotransferase (APT) family kinase protein
LPATLAHNDFNQRNVGFRPGVLVLDWELVEFNTAHRDLAEMLTFVLPEDAGRDQVDAHLERHRATLVEMGVTKGTDRDAWVEGFRSEVKTEAIDRISLQFLFGAAFPLAYLVRINRNIERLLDMYG